ncbi:unnamed protein product, partial [Rotaria socialis]
GIQNALQGSEADRRILQDKLEQSRYKTIRSSRFFCCCLK